MAAEPARLRGGRAAGYLLVLVAALLWGLLGPASRFALREGVSAVEVAFWRAALGGVLFAAHAAAAGSARVARRDLPAVAAFGAVGISFFYVSYFRAVQEGGAALAAVLLYTAPMWVAGLSAAFLGERMDARKAGAVALALAGVAGIALAGGGGVRLSPAALGWGLAAGWAYALYYLFGKRYFTRYSAASVFVVALPVGALLLLPLVPFAEKTAATWAVLAFLAVVPTYGAYLAYAAGLRRIEATAAATVATLEPVVATAAAYAVWGETLGAWGYASAGLVVLGVLAMVGGGGRAEAGRLRPEAPREAPPGSR